MDEGPFRYSKEIDVKIKDAVEVSLKIKVISAEKILKGEFNHVYKIKTDKNVVVARVFRNKFWPEGDKPIWVESKLIELDIPHAKVIYHSRDNKFFPYGFMITEFIQGLSGWDAISSEKITFEQYNGKLSSILAEIHKVKVGGYGTLNSGRGHHKSFTESKLNKLEEIWAEAKQVENLPNEMYQKAREIVKETLEKLQDRFSSVLIHGDAGPDNSILTPGGEVILVDWDGAKGSIWFEEYSWMMYWGSHSKQIFDSATEIRNSKDFTDGELWQLTRALHIIQSIDLLPYFYKDQRNMKGYKSTKEKLEKLLNEPWM